MLTTTFDPSRPYRYVVYARMSDPSQNPRSPDQQFSQIERELKRCGHPWVIIAQYRDDAKSGRFVRKRPGFWKLLGDIRSGKVQVDLIIVDTLERFGRMKDLATIRYELEVKFGVLILTADSRFADPTSSAGKALGFVENLRATSDAQVKAHNVLRGKLDAAKQRHWPGGPAPRGFKLESVMKPGSEPAEVDYRVLVPDPANILVPVKYFELAHERGWGGLRIAKRLNADEEFVRNHGRVSASGVNHALSNPIYIGTLRFNVLQTDVIDDHRVARKNDPSEVIYVENFCTPIVDRKVFEEVRQMRRSRSAAIQARRAGNSVDSQKEIKPLAPGLTLTYPLSGLVRCAICLASMNASRSGGATYYYYRCTIHYDGRCSNSRKIRGDWLFRVVIARLRERLFPLPTAESCATPSWLHELISELRAEFARRAEGQQDARPLLERELGDIESRIAGWSQSLSKTDLSTAVRSHVEEQFGGAITRKQEIEAELVNLDHQSHHLEQKLDVQLAIDHLLRLDETLERRNPTAINIELARHIECILVHPDGRIVMRTNRLGVFDGLTELLATPAEKEITAAPADSPKFVVSPRRALLPRNTASCLADGGPSVPEPNPMPIDVKLPDRWIHEEVFRTPRFHSWSTVNAGAVQAKYEETGGTKKRLAEFFGVSTPTIRNALKKAARGESW